MGLFDKGAGISTSTFSQQAVGVGSNVLGAIGTVGRIAGALNNLSNPAQLVSQLRSANLPFGGNANGMASSAGASWTGSEADKDWRVRLSLPTDSTFSSSPVLQPLKNAGGMVFPYTPQISISSTANYEETTITHQNYQFINYQNSKADTIQITAPFYIEDAVQAQYWLATVHYFRSVTKMFTGDLGTVSGNPPPVVLLNGYGDYVFKNIPVIVKSFTVDLPQDVNYIATTVGQASSAASLGGLMGPPSPGGTNIAQRTAQLAGLAGALGSADIAKVLGVGSLVASGIQAYKNASTNNSTGIPNLTNAGKGGSSHVPVKSSVTVTLQPIYSRESMRKFNLYTFVSGGYLNNKVGYL
jgi:hypothetical protein